MATKKIRFTLQRIGSLECEPGKSQTIYWDSETPNLGVRVTPTGNKSFVFETSFNDKTLRLTIGSTNQWGLESIYEEIEGKRTNTHQGARDEAKRLKLLTDQGASLNRI